MKIKRPAILLLGAAILTLVVTTCRKDDDSPEKRRDEITTQLNEDINADSIRNTVMWLQGFGTRFALSGNHREVAMRIMNRYKNMGYNDTRLDSFMISKTYKGTGYQQWQYNVIAVLGGSEDPGTSTIIGAHYDNILTDGGDPFMTVPGAHDNASGVAAAIEIARVMKQNNYTPSGSIEFIAFASEELGLYGSFDYAGKSYMSEKKIRFMLNNDMIAYENDPDPAHWTVNILDYENSVSLRIAAEKLAGRYSTLSPYNDNTFNKYSDSYSFFLNGYKALFFYSGTEDPNYHTLNDKADKLNFEYCREITRACCAMLVYNN